MNKKFLIVADFYKPHLSGVVSYIDYLIDYLKKNNYDITILTTKHEKNLKCKEIYENIKIIRCKPFFKFSRGFFSLELIITFIKERKKNHYVNIHYPLTEIFPLIFFIKKNTFLTYHCLPYFKSIFLKFIKLYFYLFGLFSIFYCEKIVIVSEDYFYNIFLYKKFKYKVIEISPPVKKINSSLDTLNLIEKTDNIVIGYLGRISEEKGLEYLIEASRELSKKNILHKIYIAGNNKDKRFINYTRYLKKISKNKQVVFLGSLTEDDKKLFYQSVDLFVLPSINSFEAFGLVQIEAMSHGTPVLASNLPGVRMPILQTKNGYLIKPFDSKDIVKNIIKWNENKNLFLREDIKIRLHQKYKLSLFEKKYSQFLNNKFFKL